MDDQWRRAKSVRWEGEDEGCAVTVSLPPQSPEPALDLFGHQSYHPTWSATEYDRTPLDPPSEAERTCALPERNARCLRAAVECFGSILDETFCSSPTEDLSVDHSASHSEESDAEAEDSNENEYKEWEECMERRRMMFAQMCPGRDRHPEFDGYRSISATLVDLLRGVGCGEGEGSSTPIADEVAAPVFSRLRQDNQPESDEPTPSLVSSAGSEVGSGVETPSGAGSIELIVSETEMETPKWMRGRKGLVG